MRPGWRRFVLFVVAVAAVIALVVIATGGDDRTANLVGAQLVFIGGMAYLITFLVWPRRSPISPSHPSVQAVRTPVPDEMSPALDKRPVLVIGKRSAGSRPGSRVHMRDTPTARSTRGRRPDERQPTGEFRWPAQRQ